MRRRRLGRTDLDLPLVVLGGMPRRTLTDAEWIRLVHGAIDLGLDAIDTAPLYELGRSERVIGQALKGRRDRVKVLTKVGLSWDADARGAHFLDVADEHGVVHPVRIDGRPIAIARGMDESLRRLGVEQVELVQVHHRDHDVPVAETMGALAELVRAGKARHVGVSNYSAEELREAQAALGDLPLASDQLELSVLTRDAAAPVIAQARALDVGLLAYSPLGAGLVGGGRPPLVDRVLDRAMAEPARRDLDRRIDAAVKPIAQQVQATIAEVLLAWTIAEPGVTAAIIGARTLEQARQAARAGTLELPATASARLASAFAGWTPPPDPFAGPRARVRSIAEKVARKVSAKLAR